MTTRPGPARPGRSEVNGSVRGSIDYASDQDWYAVTLEAGATYRIVQDYLGSSVVVGDVQLYGIHDSDGVLIPDTEDSSWRSRHKRSEVVFEATEDGTYYVSAGSGVRDSGTYKLSVTQISAADQQTADTETTGTVEMDGSVTGEIEFEGDRDWFAVTLEAGTTYRIDLEGAPTDAGTLRNPNLRGIHDSTGTLLDGTTDDNDGKGLNGEVTFTPSESGTYYVSAGATGSGTGTYKLSVTNASAGDQQTADTETAGTVEVDGSVTGEIDFSGDRDWYAIVLEADTAYRIDLEGAPTRAGTLRNPNLRGIHDSTGTLLDGTTSDDGGVGRNSRVHFTAPESGTYYVSADANGTGTYKLSVTNASAADTLSAGLDTTGTVEVDGSVRGEIDFKGDRDWYAIELEADTTYRIDLEGAPTGAGTLRDPNLRGIHDSTGTLLDGTANDDGGEGRNSRVTFEAPEGGTYYVSASVYGFGTGTYTLSVEEVM